MKTFFKYQIAGLALAVLAFAGCQKTELTDPISPDGYPTATFTTEFSGSEIKEGDTIKYTITLDKPIDRAITFSVRFDTLATKADVNDADFIMDGATAVIEPYTTETELMIIVNYDNIPENSETLRLEVGSFLVGERYLLNPKTENPKLSLTVQNVNEPGFATVAFEFESAHGENDIDIFAIHETEGDWNLSASSDNPEIIMFDAAEDPDGKYYITIDPYHVVGSSFTYKVRVGKPDGSVEIVEGVFNTSELETYTVDFFAYWGIDTYRVITLTKSGETYTVTNEN